MTECYISLGTQLIRVQNDNYALSIRGRPIRAVYKNLGSTDVKALESVLDLADIKASNNYLIFKYDTKNIRFATLNADSYKYFKDIRELIIFLCRHFKKRTEIKKECVL